MDADMDDEEEGDEAEPASAAPVVPMPSLVLEPEKKAPLFSLLTVIRNQKCCCVVQINKFARHGFDHRISLFVAGRCEVDFQIRSCGQQARHFIVVSLLLSRSKTRCIILLQWVACSFQMQYTLQ